MAKGIGRVIKDVKQCDGTRVEAELGLIDRIHLTGCQGSQHCFDDCSKGRLFLKRSYVFK